MERGRRKVKVGSILPQESGTINQQARGLAGQRHARTLVNKYMLLQHRQEMVVIRIGREHDGGGGDSI